eukprot:NODE_2490_length_1106_cov_3.896878_g2069_i0.p1 GENE.NODE_2490_length_1106_cov_3.896878_g2069_i0~~NODE_2490_length_1106_cov_3.896878_g2069_i0.p1  ORF type:complete len:233 (-),score=21.49 NODE_2490_length_1106_cov_3.896878_g2069_i0:10-708(-)
MEDKCPQCWSFEPCSCSPPVDHLSTPPVSPSVDFPVPAFSSSPLSADPSTVLPSSSLFSANLPSSSLFDPSSSLFSANLLSSSLFDPSSSLFDPSSSLLDHSSSILPLSSIILLPLLLLLFLPFLLPLLLLMLLPFLLPLLLLLFPFHPPLDPWPLPPVRVATSRSVSVVFGGTETYHDQCFRSESDQPMGLGGWVLVESVGWNPPPGSVSGARRMPRRLGMRGGIVLYFCC